MKKSFLVVFILLAAQVFAAPQEVHVTGSGAAKITVSVAVEGSPAFVASLKRNLVLSGGFQLVGSGAAVAVTGSVGSGVTAAGLGKSMTLPSSAADDKAARMEARRLADKMCEVYARTRGFAQDRIAFVSRRGKGVSELCTCYPDGYDIRQLTSDGKCTVGPRWKDGDSLFYTGILSGGPQVFELNTATGQRRLKWSFKGLTTGAAVSPDGSRVALILSIHGNPELYVINLTAGTWSRLTTTPFASEGQPSWSPDGKSIVYVSDESRRPHLYVIDVATRAKRRLTSQGTQNVDPDWGADGRIAYITKRSGGNQIAVISSAEGDRCAQLVGEPGNWEHPSWSRDGRHVVAGCDKALWVVDTAAENADGPVRLFTNAGNWITPSWSR
ncbi:MAG: hypothetical protein ACI4R9_01130 [Kiritimatiellia bacterium]